MSGSRYLPSRLLGGDFVSFREASFTRWMSRDLLQAATDFCRNLRLLPIYAETSAEGLTRYLFWNPPSKAACEVRSGRAADQFEKFAQANRERGWPLLTLHVTEGGLFSAVWISPEAFPAAEVHLKRFGITAAMDEAR